MYGTILIVVTFQALTVPEAPPGAKEKEPNKLPPLPAFQKLVLSNPAKASEGNRRNQNQVSQSPAQA